MRVPKELEGFPVIARRTSLESHPRFDTVSSFFMRRGRGWMMGKSFEV